MPSRNQLLIALFVFCGGCGGCAHFSAKGKTLEATFQSIIQGQPVEQTEAKLEQLCQKKSTTACALLDQTVALHQSVSMLQGFTNASEALISAVVPKDQEFAYLILRNKKPYQFLKPEISKRDFSNWRVDRVHVTGLNPDSNYEIWLSDSEGRLWDRREFKSLNLNDPKPRIIVASCMDDAYVKEQHLAWQKVLERKPDLLFLIGDNVYADKYTGGKPISPEIIWNRYVETFNLLTVYRSGRLVPVLSVWDDHDYGSNNGNRDFQFKKESHEIFLAFFPRLQVDKEWKAGPGLSGVFHAFNQRFFFLDNRSFRTPNNRAGPLQTHFGEDQVKWLMNELKSKSTPSWLISGDQFFGAYHNFESFEGSHGEDFARFTEALKRIRTPFIFVSGDRHMTELMKIKRRDVGQVTYELTSSGLHAKTYPGSLKRNPNPRRLKAAAGPLNFMEVEPSFKKNHWRLKVRSWGLKEGLLFERLLRVGEDK